MSDLLSISTWPDRLEALVDRIGEPLALGRVVASCDSTQDLARTLGVGAVVLTGRQTAGRGQRGNAWADTGDDGLAFSVCLEAVSTPETSVAVAESIIVGLEPLLPRRLRVKRPNDVMLEGRKLAGVLIEQSDDVAVIGIGINISQTRFPEALADTAISLRQADITVDRFDVFERVLPEVCRCWTTA